MPTCLRISSHFSSPNRLLTYSAKFSNSKPYISQWMEVSSHLLSSEVLLLTRINFYGVTMPSSFGSQFRQARKREKWFFYSILLTRIIFNWSSFMQYNSKLWDKIAFHMLNFVWWPLNFSTCIANRFIKSMFYKNFNKFHNNFSDWTQFTPSISSF